VHYHRPYECVIFFNK
jgi:diadenosine tetraphosphatase ApaH/serine/threonine PP2A family protein phosphatase